jgi:ribosomal protein L11 methylase PrmA
LDTKIKSVDEDPDRKWITIWNDYLNILSISSDGYITAKRKEKMNTMKTGDCIVLIIRLGNAFLC